jgi:hypothetical protein
LACGQLTPMYTLIIYKYDYSAHSVHDHPTLDSGFRRNDVSHHALPVSVIPAKAGIQPKLSRKR